MATQDGICDQVEPSEFSTRIRRKIAVAIFESPTVTNGSVAHGQPLGTQSETNDTNGSENLEPDDMAPPVASSTPKAMTPVEPTSFSSIKHWLLSIVIVLSATLTGVAETQLAKQAYSSSFYAPFLMMYTNQFTRLLTFPIFLMVARGAAHVQHQPFSYRVALTNALKFFGPNGPTILGVLKIVVVLGVANIGALGLFLTALRFISATDTTTLFTSQVAITYVISVIFLKQQLLTFKIFATALCFTGVGLTAYANGFRADHITGVSVAVAAAVVYASASVYMKIVLQSPDVGAVCLYMSCTSIFVLLFGWVLPLCLRVTHVEHWEFSTAPWGYIFGSGISALMIDTNLRGMTFSTEDIIGAACICLGFLLIVVPNDRVSIKIKARINHFREKRELKSIQAQTSKRSTPEEREQSRFPISQAE